MRIKFRIKFFVFLVLFLIVLPVFCIVLGLVLSENDEDFYEEYEQALPAKPVNSGVISQSVLIGYSNADNIQIFSAFALKNQTIVVLSSYGYLNRRVYCRLFDGTKREIGTEAVSVFPEFTAKCAAHTSAEYVSVTVNTKDVPENMHRIYSTTRPAGRSEFAVCLAPLFGETPKVLMLIEFVEYYALQGADTFLIYSYNMSEETSKLLDFYKTSKNIMIIPIGNSTKCVNRHRCRHEMQLQDCVFRTRSLSKWVATVDLDERIMAVREKTRIVDLLRKANDPKIGELRFRCQWTLRYSEIPPGAPQTAHLPMMTWHNTSHVAPQNHTTKSIIRPQTVDSMGVHGVQKFVGNKFSVKLVEPDEAVVRHYRFIKGWSFFLKEAESFGAFWNYEMSRDLADEIVKRVQQAIDGFTGNSS